MSAFKYFCLGIFIWMGCPTRGEENVSGLVGDSVILPSGDNIHGQIQMIRWTIWSNFTIIADYVGADVTYHFSRFQGRLHLNKTTGNLYLNNLTMSDQFVYTVQIVVNSAPKSNKVNLIVHDRVPKPNIEVVNSALMEGFMGATLRCSVNINMITRFTWSSEPLPEGCAFNQSDGMQSYLTAWCSPRHNVNISCTVSDGHSSATSLHTLSSSDSRSQEKDGCAGSSAPVIISITLTAISIFIVFGVLLKCGCLKLQCSLKHPAGRRKKTDGFCMIAQKLNT